MRRTFILLCIGVLLSLTILGSWAEANVAVSNISTSGWSRTEWITEGWQFTPTSLPIGVTHLGMWDDIFASQWLGTDDTTMGFAYEIPIGIWRVSDQALLTSTTLGPGTGDPLLGEFRYAEITPILLSPGETYAIGYQSANNIPMSEFVQTPNPGDFQVDPATTYVMHVWSADPGFRFPDIGNILNYPNTCFGPNFQFSVIPDVIPAPGAVLLGSIGVGLVGWLRRRRTL